MTREIKFRVWDKIEELMHYQENGSEGVEFSFGGTNCVRVYEYMPQLIDGVCIDDYGYDELEEAEIMQYTGLKDKNGKEIYEGDIVLGRFILDDVEDYIYLSLTDMERKNQSKTFLIEDISYLYTNPIPEDIEVIGNIYENKELIK